MCPALVNGSPLEVGRDPGADLTINNPFISEIHCALKVQEDNTAIIMDVRSSNGTKLARTNDDKVKTVKLDCYEHHTLLPGDIIAMNDVMYRFQTVRSALSSCSRKRKHDALNDPPPPMSHSDTEDDKPLLPGHDDAMQDLAVRAHREADNEATIERELPSAAC